MTGWTHVEHVMGMAVSIDVRDEVSPRAVEPVIDWLHHVDATFSPYLPDSAITRLGTGASTLDEMTAEVIDVLALCERVRIDTDGAFDAFAVPAPNGSNLDPSGLVKGWSIERAAHLLEHQGVANFCINAGGDIAVRGRPTPGNPWRVGIRHPDRADHTAAVLEVAGPLAVATSATYERGAHIVEPSTGTRPTEMASVTVVGPDLTFVDAYATAVFVMGVDGLDWLLRHHPDHAGMVITRDDQLISTPNFTALRG